MRSKLRSILQAREERSLEARFCSMQLKVLVLISIQYVVGEVSAASARSNAWKEHFLNIK